MSPDAGAYHTISKGNGTTARKFSSEIVHPRHYFVRAARPEPSQSRPAVRQLSAPPAPPNGRAKQARHRETAGTATSGGVQIRRGGHGDGRFSRREHHEKFFLKIFFARFYGLFCVFWSWGGEYSSFSQVCFFILASVRRARESVGGFCEERDAGGAASPFLLAPMARVIREAGERRASRALRPS